MSMVSHMINPLRRISGKSVTKKKNHALNVDGKPHDKPPAKNFWKVSDLYSGSDWAVCEVWADRWVEGEGGWPEGWVGGRCVRGMGG